MATVPQVDTQIEELVKSGFKKMVLDLGGLTFLDSTGLRLLLKWTHAARADGLAFELLPGGPTVERVLDIAGVRTELDFVAPHSLGRA
jgi:anti-sigma B factor antagonist